MAAEARARGVEIHTNSAVARVLTRGGRAIGIALADRPDIKADRLLSHADAGCPAMEVWLTKLEQ